MININVRSNMSTVRKALDAFGKNQIPFATSRALNDTAFKVRKHIVHKTYPQSFDVKNKSFANTMYRIEKSTKRKLYARVFDRLGRSYMTKHAEGGIKDKRGRYTAIPAADRPVVRGKAGYERNKPRTIIAKPKAFQQTVDGQQMILERRTKKRYPLKRMYLLEEKQIKIRKSYPFYEEGQRIAQRHFARAFAVRYRGAMMSARRR